MRPIAAVYYSRPPIHDEIESFLKEGMRRFVFCGESASKWADVCIDVLTDHRVNDDPIEDAQSMILRETSLEEVLVLIYGVSEEDNRSGVLVL